MNRAAEAAVAMGRDLLVGTVRTMNVTYLKNILKGGEASVTNFFAAKTRTPLSGKFLPVVTKATETVGLAESTTSLPARRPILAWSKHRTPTCSNTSPASHWTGFTQLLGRKKRKSARTRWAPAARF